MKTKKGFTLIELMISMAIFAFALAGIFSLYGFTSKTLMMVTDTSGVLDGTRYVAILMEHEVRQARSPQSGVFGVTVLNGGNEVAISTYINGNPSMVGYRVEIVDGMTVLQRAVYPNGSTPATWTQLLTNVTKVGTNDYFCINGKSLFVQLKATDINSRISNPIEMNDSFSVRSKGAMP